MENIITPLCLTNAIRNGNAEMITYLVKKGAVINPDELVKVVNYGNLERCGF